MNLITLASLYVPGIGKAHALIDGNKRLAFLSLSVFLNLNFVHLIEPEEGFFGRKIIDLMADELSLKEFQAALAHNAKEVEVRFTPRPILPTRCWIAHASLVDISGLRTRCSFLSL